LLHDSLQVARRCQDKVDRRDRAIVEMRRRYLIAGVAGVAALYYGWWLFWSGDNFRRHSDNAANRQAILQIHSGVAVGADRETVLQAFWSSRTHDLRLDVDNPDRWLVSMPGEFGASDWTLIVEFHVGKVSALRVRTADGPRPQNGPADKGTPDA
jgi:hypothetical protein